MNFDKLNYHIRQAQLPEGDDLNLPKGWEIKNLGEVSEILNGGTPKSKVKEYWNGDINWITPADLGKLDSVLVGETPRKITELGLQKSSAKVFPENSVILSTRAPIGHLAINEVPMSTNQGCRGIVPSEKLQVWFLYYFLKMNVELLDSLGTGATFKELSTKALAGVVIPIPPLPEQQRIVSILDKCFSAIERSRNNAEQNLKNVKELFKSYLQGVFENENWEMKTIDEACEEIFAGGDAPKNNFSSEPNEKHKIPIYANAVKDRGLYGYTDFARVTKPCVTIAARGSGTGHTELRSEQFLPIVRLIVCIPYNSQMSTEFLKYTIDSLVIQRSGSAIPQLTVPMIKEYKISVPTIEEQKQIIEYAETLRAETQKMEAIYQKKIADLDELKKSVLQKAFAGELNLEAGTEPVEVAVPKTKKQHAV
jgi:type I restriction enzyme S subunit